VAWILAFMAVGVVLRWQALDIGFIQDDHIHQAMLDRVYPGQRSPLDLFTPFRADPDEHLAHRRAGTLPWWAVSDFYDGVLRPLATVLVWLDARLAPGDTRLHHLHSLLWWAGTIAMAGLVLFELFPAGLAALALALFALDDGVSVSVAWLANRGVLISALLAFAALDAHLRWRRRGWRAGPAVEVGLLALAFAGGEYAISIVAYVAAYELLARGDSWGTRLRGTTPSLAVLAGYLLVHRVLGYGTMGSAAYADPFDSPLAYLDWARSRIPRLLAELFWSLPSSVQVFQARLGTGWTWWLGESAGADAHRAALVAIATVATAFAAAVVAVARAGLTAEERRPLDWLLLGSVLGLLPLAVAPAAGRLLLIPGLGGAALLAAVLVAARRLAPAGWRRVVLVPVALVLAGVHLVVDPLVGMRDLASMRRENHRIDAGFRASLPGIDLADRDVILIAAPDMTTGLHGAYVLRALGRPLPRSWQVLSMTPRRHAVVRTARDTIDLLPIDGGMLRTNVERFFRPDERPLAVGDRIESPGMSAEVLQVGSAGVERVRFRFAHDLDDPRYLVVVAAQGGLRRLDLPAVGGTVVTPFPQTPRREPQ
jgi:hypothetical protein